MTSARRRLLALIEHLGLPEDRTGMQGLRGWDVHDGAGTHIGRVIGRSTVVAAEWLDTLTDDWLFAKWSCRRLECAVHEIVRLRDDHADQRSAADARRTELQQCADYADHLQRHGLVLDEDCDERYADRTGHATEPARAADREAAEDFATLLRDLLGLTPDTPRFQQGRDQHRRADQLIRRARERVQGQVALEGDDMDAVSVTLRSTNPFDLEATPEWLMGLIEKYAPSSW
ncbi:hypothetical protein ACW4TU_45465 (plasmid) [Streptomyces sp. QTS52]